MRQMENPSNQTALPGLDPKGEQRMKDARQWVAMHPDEWRAYKDMARQECSRTHDRKASPNRCILARIAMEEDPGIRMRVARSDADGYTTARLK